MGRKQVRSITSAPRSGRRSQRTNICGGCRYFDKAVKVISSIYFAPKRKISRNKKERGEFESDRRTNGQGIGKTIE